jgi:phage major head subunit gpT-like protein
MLNKFFHKSIGMMIGIFSLLVMSVVPAFAGQGYSVPSALYGIGGAFVVGLVVNSSTLTSLYTTFKTVFNKAFSEATPQYTKIAMVVPSTTKTEIHEWIGAFPKMRQWIKERKISNLKGFKWSIENKDWESTVAVPRNDIEDDTFGLFTNLFSSMGGSAKKHPDQIVFKLLNDGFTALCYDGKAFFATDHQGGSNKATAVLSPTSYAAALASIGRMKDDTGEAIFDGTEKLTLITGPELEATAKKILFNDYVSVANGSQENNIHKGSAEYVKSPQITSATAWFITIENNGIKPLIFQERKKPEFLALNDPKDANVFMSKEFLFGVDSRDNAGYGLYHFAYGSTGLG